MLNAEQPFFYQRQSQFNPTPLNRNSRHYHSASSLPTLSPNDSPFKEKNFQIPFNKQSKYNPRSSLVSTIIHGQTQTPSKQSHHYIDSIERFKRDHASKDKQERELKRLMKERHLEVKRQIKIQRDNSYKQREENNVRKIINQNETSFKVYKTGGLKNSFTNSIPVDLINLKYHNSESGRYQEYIDHENKIKNLVRTHHLQTCGTSGYNIINGSPLNYISERLLPKENESQQKFEKNLQKFYSKYTINPPTFEEMKRNRSEREY